MSYLALFFNLFAENGAVFIIQSKSIIMGHFSYRFINWNYGIYLYKNQI